MRLLRRPTRLAAFLLLALVWACQHGPADPFPTPALASQVLILASMQDLPPKVLQGFEAEYRIRPILHTYDNPAQALVELGRGEIHDLVILDSLLVPALAVEGKLLPLDLRYIPNARTISANWRDLALDPRNRYSLPFVWSAYGLVVRPGLAGLSARRWLDLWEPPLAGKTVLPEDSRLVIGMTLKALGFSANSEEPEQLATAQHLLAAIRPRLRAIVSGDAEAVSELAGGRAAVTVGDANTALRARGRAPDVQFHVPEGGTILGLKSFVVPANSPRRATAETLLNYLLRAEVAAQIVNETNRLSPVEGAFARVIPEILPILPGSRTLADSELLLPLSPRGESLYQRVWEAFRRGAP